MSTKIYDAYQFPEGVSLSNLTERVFEIKKPLVYEANKELLRRIFFTFTHAYDYCTVFGKEKTVEKSDDFLADKKWGAEEYHQYIDKSKLYKHIADGNYELAFICAECLATSNAKNYCAGIKSNLLVIPYKEKLLVFTIGSLFLNQFSVQFLGLEDYHYQNQSERPSKISEEEWKERERVWNEAIGPDYIPQNHGFIFRLVDPEGLDLDVLFTKFKKEDVLSLIPSLERRKQLLIKEDKADPEEVEKLEDSDTLQNLLLQRIHLESVDEILEENEDYEW